MFKNFLKITSSLYLYASLLLLSGCRQGSLSSILLAPLMPPPIIDRDIALDMLINQEQERFKQLFLDRSTQEVLQVFGTGSNNDGNIKYKIKHKGYIIYLEFYFIFNLCKNIHIVVHNDCASPDYSSYGYPSGWQSPQYGYGQTNGKVPMVVVTQTQTASPPVVVSHAQQK